MINWLWAIPWVAIIIFTVGFFIGIRTARKENLELNRRIDNERDFINQLDTLREIVERRYDALHNEMRFNEDRFLEINRKLNEEEKANG